MTTKGVQTLLMPEIRRLGEKIFCMFSPEADIVTVESIILLNRKFGNCPVGPIRCRFETQWLEDDYCARRFRSFGISRSQS